MSNRSLPIVAGLLTFFVSPSFAHDIITTNLTYTRDISRVMARRCAQCHGAASSIPLTSYEEVRPWAVDIKEQILNRTMPPWGAVKGFGNFAPDDGLTQEEILIISAWVVGGAPEGDPSMLPRMDAPARAQAPPLAEVLKISAKATLSKPLVIYAIEPVTDSVIPSSRITATLPDGRIEPLVWLYQYNPQQKHPFRFREPLELPAGTTVEAKPPLDYTLETSAHSALTGSVKTTVFTSP